MLLLQLHAPRKIRRRKMKGSLSLRRRCRLLRLLFPPLCNGNCSCCFSSNTIKMACAVLSPYSRRHPRIHHPVPRAYSHPIYLCISKHTRANGCARERETAASSPRLFIISDLLNRQGANHVGSSLSSSLIWPTRFSRFPASSSSSFLHTHKRQE